VHHGLVPFVDVERPVLGPLIVLAFMFETRQVINPTHGALHGTPPLQSDYMSHWLGLKKIFEPTRP
jgi:homogentisate 1,2-dioxygenase